jgi:hypothetical protein
VIAEVLAPDPRCLRRRCSKLHAAGAVGHVRSRLFVAGRRALPGLLSLGSSKPKPRWSHGGEGRGHASREAPGAAAAAVSRLAAAGGPAPVPRAAKPGVLIRIYIKKDAELLTRITHDKITLYCSYF